MHRTPQIITVSSTHERKHMWEELWVCDNKWLSVGHTQLVVWKRCLKSWEREYVKGILYLLACTLHNILYIGYFIIQSDSWKVQIYFPTPKQRRCTWRLADLQSLDTIFSYPTMRAYFIIVRSFSFHSLIALSDAFPLHPSFVADLGMSEFKVNDTV